MAISPEHLTKAIIEAIWLCGDPKYAFPRGTNRPIPEDWFQSFIGEWGVARTIGQGNVVAALNYLNECFMDPINRRYYLTPNGIDEVKIGLRDLELTPRDRKPISLVSKIAFLCRPDLFPPYDQLAKAGLNIRRGGVQSGGEPYLNSPTYQEYLTAWNREFRKEQGELVRACQNERWRFVAEPLHVSLPAMQRRGFIRKVFDNALAYEAGGRSSSMWAN